MTEYTRPERSAELRICWKLLDRVKADPCGHCIHRQQAWGKHVCSKGREYPACTRQGTPQFEFDETFRSAA